MKIKSSLYYLIEIESRRIRKKRIIEIPFINNHEKISI